MSKLDSILSDAESLTYAERRKLAELLLKQTELEAGADDMAAGLRGLRAWTESVAGEDWSAYYPDDLGNRGSSSQ
jgi:hypothetical protein